MPSVPLAESFMRFIPNHEPESTVLPDSRLLVYFFVSSAPHTVQVRVFTPGADAVASVVTFHSPKVCGTVTEMLSTLPHTVQVRSRLPADAQEAAETSHQSPNLCAAPVCGLPISARRRSISSCMRTISAESLSTFTNCVDDSPAG